MKNIKTLGIDLAKNVFQIHGTDAQGKCVIQKRLGRDKLLEFLARLSPCLIGVEASTGAHLNLLFIITIIIPVHMMLH